MIALQRGKASGVLAAARDLLLGVQVVRPDGRSFQRGRMVVKNVAGYDLARLQYGAFGALGVITSLIFKLHPLPETSAAVIGAFASPQDADTVARRLLDSRLQPVTVLIFTPLTVDAAAAPVSSGHHWRLLARFDGRALAVQRQVGEVTTWLREAGAAEIETMDTDAVATFWPTLTDFSQMAVCGDDEALLRVIVRSSETAAALIEFAATDNNVFAAFATMALADVANGVIWLRVRGDVSRLPGAIAQWRVRWPQTILAAAPPAIKTQLNLWGAPPSALRVMQRLKQHFDPHGVLSVGRDLVSASMTPTGASAPAAGEVQHVR